MNTEVAIAGSIEIDEMLYVGVDADTVEWTMEDTLVGAEGRKVVRVRVGIFTRTGTPALLGYYEYELLGWRHP